MSRRRRLYAGLGLVLLATVVGTVAYMMIEGLDFLDALYLSVITISTVGFAEPAGGFSATGQLATILLVVIGVGSVSTRRRWAWSSYWKRSWPEEPARGS